MLIRQIENQIFRKAAPLAIRHLAKPDLTTKNPLARQVLDQASREFQVAPPITIHMPDPVLMAGVWCAAREAYVVNAAGRAMREAVAAAVSRLNECPYCVTVHSSLFASTNGGVGQLDDPDNLPPKIKHAYNWAAATLSPQSQILRDAGLAPADRPQIMGTAILYHYLNRMVSVFLQDTPVALPGMATALGQKMMRASFTFFGNRFARLNPKPGQCVGQMDAGLPDEFSWANANEYVASALAQWAWAAQLAGEEALSVDARTLVLDHLSSWHGEQPELSRGWVEDLVAALDESQKPAGRLALLAARAAYQVDDNLIAEFRKVNPDDKALVQVVAWASFAAARRIASWF